MASWVRTITSPFKKACTFFNHNHHHHKDKKSKQGGHEHRIMDLQGEVMACAYEDVKVMWSILDKSKPITCTYTS
ncbi:Unknown protein [Striga hermonthica]|uniref:Uncharacterized protein n=1 Tax=Striga hermonthica TaxID=68872 RepID=A0A9N7R323_STRHE|nr:Unknown protein [Striga hermonthica]